MFELRFKQPVYSTGSSCQEEVKWKGKGRGNNSCQNTCCEMAKHQNRVTETSDTRVQQTMADDSTRGSWAQPYSLFYLYNQHNPQVGHTCSCVCGRGRGRNDPNCQLSLPPPLSVRVRAQAPCVYVCAFVRTSVRVLGGGMTVCVCVCV